MIGVSALINNPGSLGSLYAPALSLSSGGTSLQTSVVTVNLPDGSQAVGITSSPISTGISSPAEIISSSVLGTLLDISA